MKIARFSTGGDPRFGIVDDDELVVLKGDPMFAGYDPTGERVPLAEATLLAPVIPRSKVVGVGKNYADHAAEMGGTPPTTPLIFLKPNTSVIGPGDTIMLPPESNQVEFEGELAIVIGAVARRVRPEDFAQVVSVTRSPTTSRPAISRRRMGSGPGPRGMTPSAPSAL